MIFITKDACAFLTNRLAEFLTEIEYPISIQSHHLTYAVNQRWISRGSKISQSGREYFIYGDGDLVTLAESEAFRALLRRLRDESKQYSSLIEKGVPRAEAAKLAFRSGFNRRSDVDST